MSTAVRYAVAVAAALSLFLAGGPAAAFVDGPDAIVGSHLVAQARELRAAGDVDAAQDCLQRAVALRDTVLRRSMLADLAEGRGDLASALAHLARARELSPSLALRQEYFRVRGLSQAGRVAAAAAELHDEEREAEERRRVELERRREEARLAVAALGGETPGEGPGETTGETPDEPAFRVEEPSALDDDPFVSGLSAVSALVRRKSASALAEAGRTEAAPRIVPLLDDPDSFVRMDAADALGVLGVESSVVPMLEHLFVERSELVLGHLVDALQRIGTRLAFNALAQWWREGKVPTTIEPRVERALKAMEEKLGL